MTLDNAIDSFRGEYFFLSNFFVRSFRYGNRTYKTAEHAFQAAKTLNPRDRLDIKQASSPMLAKKLGQRVELRPGWDNIRIGVMRNIVAAKFEQHPDLMTLLIETGNLDLIEGNNWRDMFWGACWMSKPDPDLPTWGWDSNIPLIGHNWLGKILMEIRGI